MAGDIEEIKSKADIVQIISERIATKKAGKHYRALCPFHGEKTPSFMISPELQIYKCFGCGEGGDVITFLEKYEGMDFNEAILYLSERTGVKLERGAFQPKKEKEKIVEINALAEKYYHYILQNHSLGKDALLYLKEKRKITVNSIDKFGIGYSPQNQSLFENFFIKKKGIKQDDLVRSGICYERYGKCFDRFAGRIIFPLYDHRGNPVGFSGRLMPGVDRDAGKYINTPDTPAYHKSELLFGLNFVKDDIKKEGYAIITEGELDMISPWQRGVRNVIAIKGSALTDAHARLLSRFTQNLTLALDSDFAGNTAAKRGIETVQSMGFKVKVARLGKYKDPDEMAVDDIKKFSKSLSDAVPVYDFIIDSAFEKYDSEKIDGKVDISKEVVPFLSKINDEILKAYYVGLLSKKLQVPYDSVYAEVEKSKIGRITREDIKEERVRTDGKRELIEETLLLLTILRSAQEAGELKRYIKSIFAKRVLEELISYIKVKEFNVKLFADNLPTELKEKFRETYIANSIAYERSGDEKMANETEDLKRKLELIDISESQKGLIAKIKESESRGDKKDVKTLQKKLNELVDVKSKYFKPD
ncbi:MAG: primase protein [Candidatus Woesebacteria bacterium GW2011_GWB1_38_5]|uniref:DNA primase n=2 Tax=Candidatus Woeseibacteriota TaxID=1752722 RepID=A0A0G0K826_9BACT|nr:MAG: primase protein [Candidatus Woesebacteria bacterium GW2011_GWC1_38_13]KKQ75002.1 MAG: primase protein [Candidatus Woesebacteria bacterium GW2011_GWB1_38_5]